MSKKVPDFLSYCGIVGPLVYLIVLVTLGALWPGYNHVSQLMSELGGVEAPHALIMNTLGLGLLGFMFFGFALVLYDHIGTGKLSILGTGLIILSGIGLVLSAAFPCDPGCMDVTITGERHSIAAIVAAVPMSFAPIAVSSYFSRRLSIYSIITGIFIGSVSLLNMNPEYSPVQGALQRTGIGLGLLWMEVVSFKILDVSKLGASRFGVWTIKHVITPFQRWIYRSTGGRYLIVGGSRDRILLLTTKGRKSGKYRTVPVFYLRDGDQLVVCNVNPGFEHTNPWVLNLRANPVAQVQIGQEVSKYNARELTDTEVERYWIELVKLWPAYRTHYERSGKRAVFVLEPCRSNGGENNNTNARREGR